MSINRARRHGLCGSGLVWTHQSSHTNLVTRALRRDRSLSQLWREDTCILSRRCEKCPQGRSLGARKRFRQVFVLAVNDESTQTTAMHGSSIRTVGGGTLASTPGSGSSFDVDLIVPRDATRLHDRCVNPEATPTILGDRPQHRRHSLRRQRIDGEHRAATVAFVHAHAHAANAQHTAQPTVFRKVSKMPRPCLMTRTPFGYNSAASAESEMS